MHYSWSTEERARRALKNVSTLLQPGGCLIGTMPDADVIVRKLRSGNCCGPLAQLFFFYLFIIMMAFSTEAGSSIQPLVMALLVQPLWNKTNTPLVISC